MSLKIRIPIIISVLLLINGVILFIYNRVYFFKQLAMRLSVAFDKEIDVATIHRSGAINELIGFEAIILTIIIICVSVIIYILYAKPLVELNNKIMAYKSHGEIKETSRKDEIGQLQNSFAQMSQNLLAEKQAQNRIIASISHDIRTPLTSVLGYTEKLIKKDLPVERKKQYLEIIHSSAIDIQNIVTEFDEYIAGKVSMQVVKQPFRVSYIAKMLQDEYGHYGANFIVRNFCEEHDEVCLDLPKIRRVFANLIGNSIKHNKHMEQLKLTVELERAGEDYRFSVMDNGTGVAPESINFIFEPFYTTQNRELISGLGLSICKDIVENHGGSISAENLEGNGFMICCWFPL